MTKSDGAERTTKRVRTPISDMVHDAACSVDLDPETAEATAARLVDGQLELTLRGEEL